MSLLDPHEDHPDVLVRPTSSVFEKLLDDEEAMQVCITKINVSTILIKELICCCVNVTIQFQLKLQK